MPFCHLFCSTDQATADSTDRDFILIYGSLGILQSLTFLVAVLHMNRLSVNASGLIHRTTLSRERRRSVTNLEVKLEMKIGYG